MSCCSETARSRQHRSGIAPSVQAPCCRLSMHMAACADTMLSSSSMALIDGVVFIVASSLSSGSLLSCCVGSGAIELWPDSAGEAIMASLFCAFICLLQWSSSKPAAVNMLAAICSLDSTVASLAEYKAADCEAKADLPSPARN